MVPGANPPSNSAPAPAASASARKSIRDKAVAMLSALLLAACLGGGSSTEDTNGSQVTGSAVYPDGTPAVNARVWVRSENFLQDPAEAGNLPAEEEARTNKGGNYALGPLNPGSYVLEVRDREGLAGSLAFRNPSTRNGAAETAPITLRPMGALAGRLMEPTGQKGSSHVQVYGLQRVVRTDTTGTYIIPDLPAGIFRIRAASSVPGWGYPALGPVIITPGDTTHLAPMASTAFLQEDYSQWPFSRPIPVDPALIGIRDTILDFPLLIRLHAGNFDFRLSNGKDLRFSGPERSRLQYEIARWDPEAREAEVWVRLDTLPGDAITTLTLHWGKLDAPDFSSGPMVFASFGGVWHLEESLPPAGMGTFRDASPSRGDAEGNTLDGDRTAAIGRGALFQGTQKLRVTGRAALKPDSAIFLSAWFRSTRTDVEGGEIMNMGDSYGIRLKPVVPLHFWVANSLDRKTATGLDSPWVECWTKSPKVTDGKWHQVVGLVEGGTMSIFLDGTMAASIAFAEKPVYALGPDFWMGDFPDGAKRYGFFGALDEVQVSGRARSRSWIRLAFENQKPGSTFPE